MTDAPDRLAAELAAIRELVAERGRLLALVMNLDAAGRDVGKLEAAERGLAAWAPRLLAAVERISALAEQWYGERGNDYSASAQYASKLRDVLGEELLGEGKGHG